MSTQQTSSHESIPLWLTAIIEDVRTLERRAKEFSALPGMSHLCVKLDHALRQLEQKQDRNVLLVTLLGATGVGKSSLFNALIEKAGASPVSHDLRCYTKQPHIAIHPADRHLLHLPDDLQPIYVDFPIRGLALCDTPDINGILAENRELTRRLVEESDVVVYVTMPERRADFDVAEEVRRWAIRKRWLFVLNRMDQTSVPEAVRADFIRRLQELGFPPDDTWVFLTAATTPDRYDLSRLKQWLSAGEYAEKLQDAHYDAFLGMIQDALQPATLEPVKGTARELSHEKARLEEQIRAIYLDGLAEPSVRFAVQRMITQATWQHAAENAWLFSWLITWIRWRWTQLGLAYSLVKLGRSGGSLTSLVGTAFRATAALAARVMPIWQLEEAIQRHGRNRLEEVRVTMQRVLEDHGLANTAATLVATLQDPNPPGSAPEGDTLPPFIVRFLKLIITGRDTKDFEGLRLEIDRAGHEAASKAGRWWVHVFANLLPGVLSAEFVARLLYVWWRSAPYFEPQAVTFPPASFYILGLGLIGVSVLPGYWLFKRRVRFFCGRYHVERLVREITQFPILDPLVTVCDRLEKFLAHCEHLRRKAVQFRTSLRIDYAAMAQAAADATGMQPIPP